MKCRTYLSVFLRVSFCLCQIAHSFDFQYLGSPSIDCFHGIVEVYHVKAFVVLAERFVVFEKVEAHHVRHSVSRSRTETNGTQNACDEGCECIVLAYTADFTPVDKSAYHVQSQYICLCLFPRRIVIRQSGSYIALAVDCVLYSQAMSDFMEGYVVEECVELDVFQLFLAHDIVCYRLKDCIEFGFHGILQLQTSCSFLQLHSLIIRKVDCYRFAARIAISCIEYHIIYVQIGLRSGYFFLEFLVARQAFLQFRQHGGELGKFSALFLVLNQDKGFVCCLRTEKAILIIFDRTHNEIQFAALHVHPCHVGSKVIVCLESLLSFLQILFQTCVLGKSYRLIQQGTHLLNLVFVLLSIPFHYKFSIVVSSQNGVKTVFVLVLQGIELLFRHILGIKTCTKRLFAETAHERLHIVQPFPRTVVNHSKLLYVFVLYRIHIGFVAVGLLPKQIVHYFGDVKEYSHQFLFLRCQFAQIRSQIHRSEFFNFYLHFRFLFCLLLIAVLAATGEEKTSQSQDCQQFSLHFFNQN